MTTNREKSLQSAEKNALEIISSIDLEDRCKLLSIEYKKYGNLLNFSAFGKSLSISLSDYSITMNSSDTPLQQTERILILHYLSHEFQYKETGKLISFRDLPGGNFYYGPFQGRTIKPLTARIGNDLDKLKKGLDTFKWSSRKGGDFSARIHAIGNIYIYLIFRLGDEEFDSTIDILFDSCIKKVFTTEDVVTLASRICLSIIK